MRRPAGLEPGLAAPLLRQRGRRATWWSATSAAPTGSGSTASGSPGGSSGPATGSRSRTLISAWRWTPRQEVRASRAPHRAGERPRIPRRPITDRRFGRLRHPLLHPSAQEHLPPRVRRERLRLTSSWNGRRLVAPERPARRQLPDRTTRTRSGSTDRDRPGPSGVVVALRRQLRERLVQPPAIAAEAVHVGTKAGRLHTQDRPPPDQFFGAGPGGQVQAQEQGRQGQISICGRVVKRGRTTMHVPPDARSSRPHPRARAPGRADESWRAKCSVRAMSSPALGAAGVGLADPRPARPFLRPNFDQDDLQSMRGESRQGDERPGSTSQTESQSASSISLNESVVSSDPRPSAAGDLRGRLPGDRRRDQGVQNRVPIVK